MEEHPSVEDFARLLQPSARPSHAERNALAVRHLLAKCPVCRDALRNVPRAQELLPRLLGLPPSSSRQGHEDSYEWAFAKTQRAFSKLLSGWPHQEPLPRKLADLASLSESEQLRRVAEDRRFADPELIQLLLDQSHSDRYLSPRKTLHLARLAFSAAEACTPEAAGGLARLADLEAQVLGNLANALRICGRVLEAEEVMCSALQRWENGTRSAAVRVTLLAQLCSLRTLQERFEEAIALAEEAGQICLLREESNLLARSLVQKALALLYSGDAESAADVLQRAIPLIDGEEDAHLLLTAHHNLAVCQIYLNRPEEALAIYYEARQLYRDCADPMIRLKAQWNEGQLLRDVGHLQSAETTLLRTRQAFIDQGLAYETAHVNMDLARVYSKLGLEEKARQMADEARHTLLDFGLLKA